MKSLAKLKIVGEDFCMTGRQKRPKMVFRKFFDDGKDDLREFGKSEGEGYVREAWMLKANPAFEDTMEVDVENDQSGN